MSNRKQMLARIRTALGREEQASAASDLSSWPELGAVMPTIAPEQLRQRFEEELKRVGGSTGAVRDQAEISSLLKGLLKDERGSGVVLSCNPLLVRLRLPEILNSLGIPAWTPPGAPPSGAGAEEARRYRERCFSAAAGITGADFALAETGSLIVSSHTEGAQLSSLAPPIHIAFYLRSQLLATLEAVLERLAVRGPEAASGRSVVFVTGTSRTADIEQILIRGVHGPGALHAILVEESCLDT